MPLRFQIFHYLCMVSSHSFDKHLMGKTWCENEDIHIERAGTTKLTFEKLLGSCILFNTVY